MIRLTPDHEVVPPSLWFVVPLQKYYCAPYFCISDTLSSIDSQHFYMYTKPSKMSGPPPLAGLESRHRGRRRIPLPSALLERYLRNLKLER